MAEELTVEKRELRGKRAMRRLRQNGKLPAVLYGHGEGSVSLALPSHQVEDAIRHGAKVVELKGAASGQALIQDLQWDAFSTHVLHLDLLRVAAGERVTVEVAIELRGESPGAKEGGIVEQVVHSISIETTVGTVPEVLHVNISDLHLNDSLTTENIEDLPKEAKILGEESATIVHCVPPREEEETDEMGGEGAEPEVIGAKDEDDEASGD